MIDLEVLSPPVTNGKPRLLADPEASANLYCAGRLCEVICRVVAPAWKKIQASGIGAESYVWIMRYAKGGEHLKVRWHGPAPRAELWRTLLTEKWTLYVDGLPPAAVGAPRLCLPTVTPIDEEDHATTDHPDRILLWTSYQRSHVSLGYRPYLDDEFYVALLTRCLGCGTEALLDCLESSPEGRSPHHLQQRLLLAAVIAGLAAPAFSAAERDRYLLYHRDSLLRAFRRRKRLLHGAPNIATVLARFEAEVKRLGEPAKQLAAQAQLHWQGAPLPAWGRPFEAWSQALRALVKYVDPVCRDREHDVDPFAESPLFPPLFKAFHGLANQIGVDPFNEAFAYHLLIALAAAPDLRQRPVALRPDL